jgi:multiple sugar transport system ATP-binding protein
MGSHLLLTGIIADRHIRIVAPPATKAQAGDRLGLVPDPTRVVWMAPETGTLVGVA